jgi:hypothetical protein
MQNLKLKKVNLDPILLKSVILLPFWDLGPYLLILQKKGKNDEGKKKEKKHSFSIL